MYARVTQFDIDTVQISMARAIQRFNEQVLPALKQQAGYRGVCALENEAGRGMLVSFWDTRDAADAGLANGFYGEQIEKFVTVYRQPPGRDSFEVGVIDWPRQPALASPGGW